MKKLTNFVEITFWTVWFSIPGIFSIATTTGQSHAAYLAGLCVFGLCLSSVGYVLRFKHRLRFRVNVSAAIAFFILYSMIGFPDLLRPNENRPLGSTILLFTIAFIPLVFFVSVRIKKNEMT